MTSQELAEIKERLKSQYSNYDELIRWLEKKHGILCPESPFELVEKAFNGSLNVNEFIDYHNYIN